MATPEIKFYYFDFNGRGEPCRLVLHYAGIKFEDIRFSRDKWPEYKPLSPFGQTPFAKIDGKVYGQSLALAQFFARLGNLYGKTNVDALKIEQLGQLLQDLFQEIAKAFFEPDPAKKVEISRNVKEEVVPKFLGFINKLLEENGGRCLVGDGVTLADILIYDLRTGFFVEYIKDAFEKLPLLTALVNKIGNNERIRAYTQSLK